MSSSQKWHPYRLDELGYVGRGKSRHRPRNDPRLFGGVHPFIQTADVMAADPYISTFSQTYSDFGLAQSKLWQKDTLCITIAGANTARSAILKFEACFPDSIVGFIPRADRADLVFIKYSLDLMRPQLLAVTRGATQDNLSLDKLLSFPILAPPVSYQRRVGSMLSSLDELIDNNSRRIAVLRQILELTYNEWFVRFRFPGCESMRMKESSLGPIPEKFAVGGLEDIPGCRFIAENVKPFEGERPYFETSDVDGITVTGQGTKYSFGKRPSRAQKQPLENSVWFARMKDTFKVVLITKQNRDLPYERFSPLDLPGINPTRSCCLSFSQL